MSDFSRFGEENARHLAELQIRKGIELAAAFEGIHEDDERIRDGIATITDHIIFTLGEKVREGVDTLRLKKELTEGTLNVFLVPQSSKSRQENREKRSIAERRVQGIINDIIIAVMVCMEPPKPRYERAPVFGQGKARKRKSIS